MKLKARSKANIEFLTKVGSVFEAFEHNGKRYLAYLAHRDAGDEFHIRSTLIVPLFQVLGYDPAKNIYHEVTSQAGDVDLLIRGDQGQNLILVETKSSTVENLLPHRPQLWKYLDELSPKFAVLTNGVRLEWFEYRGKGKVTGPVQTINFKLTYERFIKRGIEGLTNDDWDDILRLRYLAKEYQSIPEEELYKDPELDVAEEMTFRSLLEDLQVSMEYVKSDIAARFEEFQAQYEEFVKLQKQVAEGKAKPWQLKGFEGAKVWHQSYAAWQSIASSNGKTHETFITETMYILFNRILLIRICEDKKITPRRISNGGIKHWLEWQGFSKDAKINYTKLLRDTYDLMNTVYPHLFHRDLFDWYVPDSEVTLKILFTFNRYNFERVDRDILGKLYEQYIDRDERKRLGQYYTPEEVVDYILEAVGYTSDNEIEGKLLLDPSCGSGGFLVRGVKALVERYRRKGVDPETILKKVQESIYGFDINPFAAHLAEMNLLFQVIDLITEAKKRNHEFHMEKFNIFQTNSLKLPEAPTHEAQLPLLGQVASEFVEDAETVKQIKLKQGRFVQGFDFVVGNPPYGGLVSEGEKELMKKTWLTTPGNYDTFAMFTEMSIIDAKLGGKIGLIVPSGWLTSDQFLKLRSYVAKTCKLESFVNLPYDVFKQAYVDNVIEVFTKKRDYREEDPFVTGIVKVLSFPKRSKVSRIDPADSRFETIDYIGWLDHPELLFMTFAEESAQIMGRKMEGDSVRLDKFADVIRGITPFHLVDSKLDESYSVALDGELRRYRYEFTGTKYVKFDPSIPEYKDPKYFRGPRLILRELVSRQMRLQAVSAEEDFITNKSHQTIVIRDKRITLYYVLGLINSKLMSFYQTKRSALAQRDDFPKIVLKDTRGLPIKIPCEEVQCAIATMAQDIQRLSMSLPEKETVAKDFRKVLASCNFATQDLADYPGITLHVTMPVGKPTIKVKETKVFLDRNNFIDCPNETTAEYLKFLLQSLGDRLRGLAAKDVIDLIRLPMPIDRCAEVLEKRQAFINEIETIKHRIEELDREIDARVYGLYGLTEEEIQIVEGLPR